VAEEPGEYNRNFVGDKSMAKNQIKIWSNSEQKHIEYYWYGENGEWSDMAERDDSPLNAECFISNSITQAAYDIYKVITESYYHPVEGIKIVFIGNDDEYDSMLKIWKSDFSEYDIEIERETIEEIDLKQDEEVGQETLSEEELNSDESYEKERVIPEELNESEKVVDVQQAEESQTEVLVNEQEEKEEVEDDFGIEDLENLLTILERYGAKRTLNDYKTLAENVGFIVPKAYLGNCFSVYFTIAGLYVELNSHEWISMSYSDLCLEDILINTREKSKNELVISDTNGNSFRYWGDKKISDDFVKLLYEMKGAKTAESDEYSPIWENEAWLYEETYLYGEILIDFLKMSKHNPMAALVKCSEFTECVGEDDEEFWRLCEYAINSDKGTLEDLKQKVLMWKNTLDVQMEEIYMAILFKDLIEILQLATEKTSVMTSIEKNFFDWLAGEIFIKEADKFEEMVMFPYLIVSEQYDEEYTQKMAGIEKFAYKEQTYIPYEILNNEKSGFWAALHGVTEKYWSFILPTKKNQEELHDLFIDSKFILTCEYMVLMSRFISRVGFLNKPSFEEKMYAFLGSNDFISELLNLLAEVYEKDEWQDICAKYQEADRRHVGAEVVEWWMSNTVK